MVAKNPCGSGMQYTLPPSGFTFGISNVSATTAMTRGTMASVDFSCDDDADKYFLLMWDAFGSFGPRGTKGFLHGAWANIGCTDGKGDWSKKDELYPYFAPPNPNTVGHLYGFYLFKQSGDIALTDGRL